MKTINKATVVLFVQLLRFSYQARLSPIAIIDEMNSEFRLTLNILVSFDNNSLSESYQNVLTTSTKSLIIYNDFNAQVQPIYQQQTKTLLVIVWLSETASVTKTITFLDRLLWQLHWMEILFIVEHEMDQMSLFEYCWSKGFTNVLVSNRGQLYTYHPYPKVQEKQLATVKAYKNKNHLKDLQGYKIYVPFFYQPPYCFNYWNRKGELVLAGFWHKLVDIFIKRYNATTVTYTVGLEEIQTLHTKRFDLVPIPMYFNDGYSHSKVFALSKVVVICASPVEINEGWYMFKAFRANLWVLCFITFIMLWLTMILIYKFKKDVWDFMGCCMDAANIMTSQASRNTKGRCIVMFILYFMPLLTGFLLANFYNCNLSSILTARIYHRPFRILEDLVTNKKRLLQSTTDINYTANLAAVPDYIKDRLVSLEFINEYFTLRDNLTSPEYYFSVSEDLAEFLLFQQLYLPRPLANVLNQALYVRPYFFAMRHRSPHLQHFNNYLMYMQENGLYDVFRLKAKWHGIVAKEIKFLTAEETNRALSLAYFHSAFFILLIAFMFSPIVFVFELYIFKCTASKMV